MINKITPETTVKEICEVLEFMDEETALSRIILFGDMSGKFNNFSNEKICRLESLPEYVEEHKKIHAVHKLKNMSEKEFSKYIIGSLVNPEKIKILYDNIKEVMK